MVAIEVATEGFIGTDGNACAAPSMLEILAYVGEAALVSVPAVAG